MTVDVFIELLKWAWPTIVVPLFLWGRKRLIQRDEALQAAAVSKERAEVYKRETAAVLEAKNTLIADLEGDIQDYQQAQIRDAERIRELERVNGQNSDSLLTLSKAFQTLSGNQGILS